MKTSSFKLHGKDPRAVSIARHPMFFKGRRYYDLAPSMALFRAWKAGAVSNEEYTERFYQETLSCLDPAQVFRDLGEDAILLCWCVPGQFCHRRIVAQWFEEALGINVPEAKVPMV
jgi:hypothetical protein